MYRSVVFPFSYNFENLYKWFKVFENIGEEIEVASLTNLVKCLWNPQRIFLRHWHWECKLEGVSVCSKHFQPSLIFLSVVGGNRHSQPNFSTILWIIKLNSPQLNRTKPRPVFSCLGVAVCMPSTFCSVKQNCLT